MNTGGERDRGGDSERAPLNDMPQRLLKVERARVRRERGVGGHGARAAPLLVLGRRVRDVRGVGVLLLRLARERPAELHHAFGVEVADVDMGAGRLLAGEGLPVGVDDGGGGGAAGVGICALGGVVDGGAAVRGDDVGGGGEGEE